MSAGNGSKTVEQLAANFVAEVRAAAANEWQQKLSTALGMTLPVPAPIAAPSIPSMPGVAAKPLSPAKLLHPHCDYPGCAKPHSGPRYRYMCRDHRGDWKAARKLRRQAERQAARHTA